MITVRTVKTVEMISEENREICAAIIRACRGEDRWDDVTRRGRSNRSN